MAEFVRATNTEEAFWALDPFAVVKPGDPRFADIEAELPREHYGVTARLARYFRRSSGRPTFVHVGLVGHQGTGKTTLVRKAMSRLASDGIMPIYVDAKQAIDQGDFTFADLMLIIAEAVIRCAIDQHLDVDAHSINVVRDWFADELMFEGHRDQVLGELSTSGGAEAKLPFLAAFSAKVVGSLRSDNEYRHEIRRRAQRNIHQLVDRVNTLLDAVHDALRERQQQLCVVFDNLEKVDKRELVDRAVLQRANEFAQLRCHLLLFFSPADEYAPRTKQPSQAFALVKVPVIPVRFRDDPPERVRDEALRAITRLLDARMSLPGVFEDVDACVHELARACGGHVRDLLKLARHAGELAEPDKIDTGHIHAASLALAGERNVLMKPEDWSRAAQIARTNKVENRDEDARMLLHSCVLAYDGQPWWDVHPVVRADARFEDASADPDER